MTFWTRISRIIIKGRYLILLLIIAFTIFLAGQMQYMRFSYTEANLLPKDHPVNIEYENFLKLFGEEGNIILLAVKDSSVFEVEKFNQWNALAKKIDSFPEIDFTIGIGDIKKLVRDDKQKKIVTHQEKQSRRA